MTIEWAESLKGRGGATIGPLTREDRAEAGAGGARGCCKRPDCERRSAFGWRGGGGGGGAVGWRRCAPSAALRPMVRGQRHDAGPYRQPRSAHIAGSLPPACSLPRQHQRRPAGRGRPRALLVGRRRQPRHRRRPVVRGRGTARCGARRPSWRERRALCRRPRSGLRARAALRATRRQPCPPPAAAALPDPRGRRHRSPCIHLHHPPLPPLHTPSSCAIWAPARRVRGVR
jgi:hypothetical protein